MVIRASDTDILIIVLGCFTLLAGDINIWLEVGIFSTQRYIDINSLYNKLGPLSLLSLHVLIGCDYTSSFSRKGKVRPFKILEKDELAQETFSQFGCGEHIS